MPAAKNIEREACEPRFRHSSDAGIVYALGFIGAAVFYVQEATTFWTGVLGVLKALVWPAMLVHKLLGL